MIEYWQFWNAEELELLLYISETIWGIITSPLESGEQLTTVRFVSFWYIKGIRLKLLKNRNQNKFKYNYWIKCRKIK